MGLYYSGGLDWQWDSQIDHERWRPLTPTDAEYASYAAGHVRELIRRYQPSILWNDLGWPTTVGWTTQLYEIFSEYLNKHNPNGVINNRWSLAKRNAEGDLYQGDFLTPEYQETAAVSARPFEMNRGLGKSFGYNRLEGEAETIAVADLIRLFIDTISKNGNLLLDIAPKADGSLSDVQHDRLRKFGQWIDFNSEAIFATRPFLAPG